MALRTQHNETVQTTSLSSSSSKISNTIFDIPKEVIIQKILASMEPKTLARLRCVSTLFNNLISSPKFCLFYYRIQALHKLHHQIGWRINQIPTGTYKYSFSTIDLAHPSNRHKWDLILPNEYTLSWMVSESSCFGLICIYSMNNACIYNPTTRAIVVHLPPVNNNSYWYPKFYLGFVNSTNRIKVLCFFTSPSNSRDFPGITDCDVLTLPEDLSGGWRKVGRPPLSDFKCPIVASAESVVYLLSLCCTSLFQFDLENESWSEINLPGVSLPQAVEFMGYLCLCSRAVESSYELWILKNNVWEKKWELNNHPKYPKEMLIPLHYDEKLDRLLMRTVRGRRLSWYWFKEGAYEDCRFKLPSTELDNIKYVETIVTLQTLRDIANVKHQT
ncbi:putative F-box protein At1g47730 [Phalaenopsis equestris]|uniref:putative F-box protein At1g47730 n=1 Tax=Phalaenopsis equestris TaxID=78828 RepID=UPI0009E55BEE|nr:putative F-box protein At1g47730 [Phalaenopsis equestris]